MSEYVSADLRNAALVMEHAGWTRNFEVEPGYGAVCAVGSIYLATRARLIHKHGFGWKYVPYGATPEEMHERNRRAAEAENWLQSIIAADTDYDDVPQWNDNEDLTREDVVATMREAADEWDRLQQAEAAPVQAELDLAGGPQS